MSSPVPLLSGLRIVLTVAMLGYASYRDVKTREVSDVVWVVFGGAGLLIDGYELAAGTIGWESMGVAVGFSLVFALFSGYLGFFGGADLLAFVAIALLNPTTPEVGLTPLVFPPVLFPLTVISDSILIGASTALVVLVVNLGSSRRMGLFEGYPKVGLGTKFLLLLTGRSKELSKVRGPPFEYPLEKLNEDGSVGIHVRPDLSDDAAAIETLNKLRSSGRGRVWVSYSLPFLLILGLGYLCAVVFGDFSLWIVSIFL